MHSMNAVRFFLNSSMLFNVFTLSMLVYHVACHECYVCGVGDIPFSCAEFNTSSKEVCPQGVTSCSLQISGNDVIARACGEARNLTDCKIANKIKYCYCASNLCNGDTNRGFDTDDEDFAENGSGYETTTTVETPTTETAKPKANDSNNLRVTLILFFHFLIFI